MTGFLISAGAAAVAAGDIFDMIGFGSGGPGIVLSIVETAFGNRWPFSGTVTGFSTLSSGCTAGAAGFIAFVPAAGVGLFSGFWALAVNAAKRMQPVQQINVIDFFIG